MAMFEGTMDRGSHHPDVLDLDAGTTVPRIVPIAGSILVIAGIAFLLAMSHTGNRALAAPGARPVAHHAFTIPAMCTMATLATHGSPHAPLIGPTAGRTAATPAWRFGPGTSHVQ